MSNEPEPRRFSPELLRALNALAQPRAAAKTFSIVTDTAARRTYNEAVAAALAAYQEAISPAWRAYEEAFAAAGRAYKEARAAARSAEEPR